MIYKSEDYLLLKQKPTLVSRIRTTILTLLCVLGVGTLLIFNMDNSGGIQISTENITPLTSTTTGIPDQNYQLEKQIHTGNIQEAKYAHVQNGELILSHQPIKVAAATAPGVNILPYNTYEPGSMNDLGFAIGPSKGLEKANTFQVSNENLYALPTIPRFQITVLPQFDTIKPTPITLWSLIYTVLACVTLLFLVFTEDKTHFMHVRHTSRIKHV